MLDERGGDFQVDIYDWTTKRRGLKKKVDSNSGSLHIIDDPATQHLMSQSVHFGHEA